ncbi:MAG: AAA family ATPase [Rhodomicrobium sp.]|nr:AAA family ATPase [Rhodomicrobium sp.]
MATVISVANMKGGVGKTTLCVSLAEGLAYLEKHVLVIDLDAQINCSQVLWGTRAGEPWKSGENIHKYLHDLIGATGVDSFPYIRRHIILNASRKGAVSLFSGSPMLFSFEREMLSKFQNGIRQLEILYQKAIDRLYRREADNFDYIIFDCPPGISLLAEAALKKSSLIIVPTAPNFLSTMGIQAFSDFLQNQTSARPWVFINQVNTSARTMARFRREIENEVKRPDPRFRMLRNYYKQLVEFQRALERYDGKAFEERYKSVVIQVKNVAEEVMEIANERAVAR